MVCISSGLFLTEKNILMLYFHSGRDSPSHPVMDALNATLLGVVPENAGQFGRAAERFN